jgi:hypothetical protein
MNSHTFTNIYVWNTALSHLCTLLVSSDCSDITLAYKCLEVWGEFISKLTEEDVFKVEYYYKIYRQLVDRIYRNFMQSISQIHLQSYFQQRPEALLTLTKCMRWSEFGEGIDAEREEVFWITAFGQIKENNVNMVKLIDYVNVLPTQAIEYLNLGMLIDKISHLVKVEEEEKRMLAPMSNQNMQKVSSVLAKISLYLINKMNNSHQINAKEDTSTQSKNKPNEYQVIKDLCHQLVMRKIENLRKNKGKLRVSISELSSIDTLITHILPTCPEYLCFYTLFISHFYAHQPSYSLNEDVPALLKYLYSSDTPLFISARSSQKPTMGKITQSIFLKHPSILRSCLVPALPEAGEVIPLEAGMKTVEEELYLVLSGIYASLDEGYQKNMVIERVEAILGKEFDRLTVRDILQLVKKQAEMVDVVGFEMLA